MNTTRLLSIFILFCSTSALAERSPIRSQIDDAQRVQSEKKAAEAEQIYQQKTWKNVSQLASRHAQGRPVSALEPICGSRPASLSPTNPRDIIAVVGYAVELDNGQKCSFILDMGDGRCLMADQSVRSFRFPPTRSFIANLMRGSNDPECATPNSQD